jgi:hypothetical protein
MKFSQILVSICLIVLSLGCNSSSTKEKAKKDNTGKEEHYAPSFKNYEDAATYLKGLLEGAKIDEYGNIEVDFGSASAGRLKLNLKDVTMKMEERPEEPGCQEMCPPRIMITFKCERGPCIEDPTMEDLSRRQVKTLDIHDIENGKKCYDVLKQLKGLL